MVVYVCVCICTRISRATVCEGGRNESHCSSFAEQQTRPLLSPSFFFPPYCPQHCDDGVRACIQEEDYEGAVQHLKQFHSLEPLFQEEPGV